MTKTDEIMVTDEAVDKMALAIASCRVDWTQSGTPKGWPSTGLRTLARTWLERQPYIDAIYPGDYASADRVLTEMIAIQMELDAMVSQESILRASRELAQAARREYHQWCLVFLHELASEEIPLVQAIREDLERREQIKETCKPTHRMPLN